MGTDAPPLNARSVGQFRMTTGRVGGYWWAESERARHGVRMPDLVRLLGEHLRGLRAVNVSWDSGRLLASDAEADASWDFHGGYAVSRPIDDDLIATWPCSQAGYDEWYFFRVLPSALELQPWCNWATAVLGEHREMAFPGGIDLLGQLQGTEPEMVLGEGRHLYVLARHEGPVQEFRAHLEV